MTTDRAWSLGWRCGYYSANGQINNLSLDELAAFERGRRAGQDAFAKMRSEYGTAMCEKTLLPRGYRKKTA